jgi:hypothetical protein
MSLPMGPQRCKVFFWRMRKVQGFERDSWRFLFRARLEERHWNVLEQDRVMLEGMPDDARRREMLYQHDIGLAHLRRALNRLAAHRSRPRMRGRRGRRRAMTLKGRRIVVSPARRAGWVP